MIDDIYELCCLAGVSIRDHYTPRQLFALVVVNQRTQWEHTSALLAQIHNIMSQSKKTPNDYNPYAEKKVKTIRDLREAFGDDDFLDDEEDF